MNFLSSPVIVTAMAFSGKLSFNPVKDGIPTPDGKLFKFAPPKGETLPAKGFIPGPHAFLSSCTRSPFGAEYANEQGTWTFTPLRIQHHSPTLPSSLIPTHRA